jgi:hypothetical protein
MLTLCVLCCLPEVNRYSSQRVNPPDKEMYDFHGWNKTRSHSKIWNSQMYTLCDIFQNNYTINIRRMITYDYMIKISFQFW